VTIRKKCEDMEHAMEALQKDNESLININRVLMVEMRDVMAFQMAMRSSSSSFDQFEDAPSAPTTPLRGSGPAQPNFPSTTPTTTTTTTTKIPSSIALLRSSFSSPTTTPSDSPLLHSSSEKTINNMYSSTSTSSNSSGNSSLSNSSESNFGGSMTFSKINVSKVIELGLGERQRSYSFSAPDGHPQQGSRDKEMQNVRSSPLMHKLAHSDRIASHSFTTIASSSTSEGKKDEQKKE